MPDTNIGSAVASDLKNAMTDYSVDTQSTDAATGQKEYRYLNKKADQQLAYYKTIPEFGGVVDVRGTWTVGKGYNANPITVMKLDTIKGHGVDTFNSILDGMVRDMWIYGDAYAEIIKGEGGDLSNLKKLDPAVMMIISNAKGIISGYEQISKIEGKKPKPFKPEQIFHLSRNRVADEIHGISLAEKLEWIILAKNEAMSDYKQVMHWFGKPRYFFHLDTDDPEEIAKFKKDTDEMWASGNNHYIPKGTVVPELIAVSPNATLNPLAWIEFLDDKFYEGAETPKFIVGNSKGFTEAAEKIGYLAFQQSVEKGQLYVEEQLLLQLDIEIDLIFPASLENELLSDKAKDVESGAAKPEDTTVKPIAEEVQ